MADRVGGVHFFFRGVFFTTMFQKPCAELQL